MPTLTEMKVKREDLNPCTIQFEVVCTPEQVKEGFDRAYKAIAKQVKVPGFRPGHAPKAVLDKMINEEAIKEEAAEFIVRGALKKVLEKDKVQPHDSPNVNVVKLEADVCEFTAKVPLKPVIELGEYKGLAIQRDKAEVTDAEVDKHLEELRARAGKREAVTERGAHEGDNAVISLKKDGAEGDGATLMVVVGQTFADLDKALLGMTSEEMKVETLSFPAGFQNKDLAGKKEKVRITLKSLSSVTLAELDDSFAQNLEKDLKSLKSETVKELKDKLKERLVAAKEEMNQELVHEQLQDELLKVSTIHVPDTMWENVANQRLNEINMEVRRAGKTIEDYAKAMGMDVETMVKNWQEEAKVQVQRAVAAREIFVKEKMRLSNEDLNQTLIQMAMDYQVHPQALAEAMQKNKNFQELEIRAVYRKVLNFLNENAVEGEAKPAAKPKAAKAKEEKPEAESEAKEAKPKKSTKK